MKSVLNPMINAQVARLAAVLHRDFKHLDLVQLASDAGVDHQWWRAPHSLGLHDYYRLLNFIASEQAPDIVVRMARGVTLSQYGAMGHAVWSGSNLGQSLQTLMHVIEWQHPYVRLAIKRGREHALIRVVVRPAGVVYYRVLVEDALFTLWQLIRSRLPDGLAACASFAHFTYPAPAYGGQYQPFFGCRVAFEQDLCALAIPAQWLHVATTVAANQGGWQATPARVRRTLALSKTDLVQEVKLLLSQRSVECAFDMTKTARMLAISERSLRRHLADAGTSFRQLCGQVRMAQAAEYLQKTGLSIQEIAYLLGYAQENNFYRAFRTFYQLSPAQFRANYLAGEDSDQ